MEEDSKIVIDSDRLMLEILSDDLNLFVGKKVSSIEDFGVRILQGDDWYEYDDRYFILIAKETLNLKSSFSPRKHIQIKKAAKEAKKNEPKEQKCVECGAIFQSKYIRKCCSDDCKRIRYNRKRKGLRKNRITDPREIAIEQSKKAHSMVEGKKELNKILNCSVECMLKELGDIE